ncbi:unnamed protein product [Trifolium pratense]|uniref:Uncharacterized protein n=1 Tax=Trifolium pratense TaxID=57577 RepID=A0ACB0K8X5_TRIPR|nr:unnamed protein product [Trifolium pratense]
MDSLTSDYAPRDGHHARRGLYEEVLDRYNLYYARRSKGHARRDCTGKRVKFEFLHLPNHSINPIINPHALSREKLHC